MDKISLFGWIVVGLIAILYYGFIFFSWTKAVKSCVQDFNQTYPDSWRIWPIMLWFVYLFYCFFTGGIYFRPAIGTLLYLLLPAYFLQRARVSLEEQDKENPKFQTITPWDWAALLAFWIPFDLHWIPLRPLEERPDWGLIAVSCAVLATIWWYHTRGMKGMKLEFSFGTNFLLKDIIKGLTAYAILAPILLWLGLRIKFLVLKPFVLEAYNANTLPSVVCDHLWDLVFLRSFVLIFMTIALSEEFLFRSCIQNFLEQKLHNRANTILWASLLFGLAHLNNHATSLAPSGWNWKYFIMATIAGVFYGTAFHFGKSILTSMLVHTLIDTTWHTFFKPQT